MTTFVFLTTATSILVFLFSAAGLFLIVRSIKTGRPLRPGTGLGWLIPLLAISAVDIVTCVIIITLLPGAPTGIAATDGTYRDRVVVTWKSAVGARDYHVLRATTPDGAYTDVSGSISKTSFIDTSARPGKYYYSVVASNDVGDSMQSAPDGGHRAINDFEFFAIYSVTEKSGIAKLKKLGTLGEEIEAGTVSGTVSYSAKFDGRARVVNTYAGYSDFSADNVNHMVLNGAIITETSALGNGTTAGRVDVTGHYSGYVKYNLVIGKKQKAGGTYLVSQDGGKTETAVPWNYR